MTGSTTINSKEYWNNRFETNWEPYSGRQQTLYFCNIAYDIFPEWFKSILQEGVSFADVGCAEGDGTNFFATRFPNSKFTGIDFSKVAIDKAKSHYQDQQFIQADIDLIEKNFDVVFSSNTLEHFINPFEKLDQLFKVTNKYTVLLLPFQEFERFSEHFFTFDYKDFHINRNGFSIVYAKEYDCSKTPNIYWAGKQILIIYAHDSVLSNHKKLTLYDYINTLSSDYTALSKELHQSQQIITDKTTSLTNLESSLIKQQIVIDEQQKALSGYINLLEESINIKEMLARKNAELDKLQDLFRQEHDEKISLLEKLDWDEKQIEWLLHEKYNVEIELQAIKSSRVWKLARKYYSIRDGIPIVKYTYKALGIWKRYGFRTLINQIKFKINNRGISNPEKSKIQSLYSQVSTKIEDGDYEGVVIIPSAFEFKELYNQRTINLAKYLADKKNVVLFVVWQWSKEEIIPKSYEEVYSGVYHVPFYEFADHINLIEQFEQIENKKIILNIPSKEWNDLLYSLKEYRFYSIYDIMDDWEEFHAVDQAPWYVRSTEEAVILNVDQVTAVSSALVDKFTHLRTDIKCVGNGYYKKLLGLDNKNISINTTRSDISQIKLGYFGHLTESWFDWPLIEELLQDPNITVEIIGYGAKEKTISSMNKYPNFKYIGKVDPSKLSAYVKSWDIGLIPFVMSKLSVAVDPIKVYEYIYFGLKVIVTGIPHVGLYPNVYLYDKLYQNSSITDFAKEVYLKEITQENKVEIEQFLNMTTWEVRFNNMLEIQNNSLMEIYENERDKSS